MFIVGLLFAIGSMYNFFISGDLYNAIIGLIISSILLGIYYGRAVEKKKGNCSGIPKKPGFMVG